MMLVSYEPFDGSASFQRNSSRTHPAPMSEMAWPVGAKSDEEIPQARSVSTAFSAPRASAGRQSVGTAVAISAAHSRAARPWRGRDRMRPLIGRQAQTARLCKRPLDECSNAQSHHDLVCRLLLEKKKKHASGIDVDTQNTKNIQHDHP